MSLKEGPRSMLEHSIKKKKIFVFKSLFSYLLSMNAHLLNVLIIFVVYLTMRIIKDNMKSRFFRLHIFIYL